MENNGNKVLLTVIGAATLLIAVVGATFAYFSASGTSQSQQVTTGTSDIELTATNTTVSNISPTTFNKAAADDGTNKDIVKMTLALGGTTETAGFYTVSMNQPQITIGSIAGDGGQIGDIKYAVYNSAGEQIGSTGSFTADGGLVQIVSSTAYEAGEIASAEDTYYVYVWIENENNDQNNLQNLNFSLTFYANATSSAQ